MMAYLFGWKERPLTLLLLVSNLVSMATPADYIIRPVACHSSKKNVHLSTEWLKARGSETARPEDGHRHAQGPGRLRSSTSL
jgi:hypothetical protein